MDLVRPCAHCPFRTDIPPFLRAARIYEIAAQLPNGYFVCHETIDYDQEPEEGADGEEPEAALTEKSEHCAGALILLEKLEQPSQLMRIYERLNAYDATKLDMSAPVYDSFEQMAEAQEPHKR